MALKAGGGVKNGILKTQDQGPVSDRLKWVRE